MIKDVIMRFVALVFLGIAVCMIYFFGWKYVNTSGDYANTSVNSSNFWWYSWLTSHIGWILLAVLIGCVLIIFFFKWGRKNE